MALVLEIKIIAFLRISTRPDFYHKNFDGLKVHLTLKFIIMNTTENTRITFYQNLGKLFYAIAASDNVVRESEYKSLKKIVKSEWLKVDDIVDEFGEDAAFQIEIVFDWMDYETPNAENCFMEFESFFTKNKSRFTDPIKQLIWNTANAIAGAFSGKNKSELMMLGRLKLIFKK